MVNWDTQNRGRSREEQYTTSYGDDQDDGGDYDGKSCADFHQLPGRDIEDAESLSMLHQMGLNAMDEDDEES